MIRKLIQQFKSQKGAAYIDTSVLVIVIIIVIALGVRVYPAIVAKQQLNTFATELKRQVEIVGHTDVNDRVAELKEQTKLDPAVSYEAVFISGTHRIQLGDSFSVSLSATVNIGFGPFGSVPIPLHSKATGRSEVYW